MDYPGDEFTIDSKMRFENVGLDSDVAHAFSVLCWHSCRHPTGRQKSRRTNERHVARNGDTAR